MNIHEYQAKKLLKDIQIPILSGYAASSVQEAVKSANDIKSSKWILKAQVHSGGRGKAGGIKIASSLDEVEKYSKELLGTKLITNQNKEGKLISKIYIEPCVNVIDEYYLAFLFDRKNECVSMVFSLHGGMDIEDLAKNNPEKITKVSINPKIGFKTYHGLELLKNYDKDKKDFIKILSKLYDFYIQKDATLIEINPLAYTKEHGLVVLDAKMSFDDSALFRHDDINALNDETQTNQIELEASKYGLNYVKLDGDIACIVNGAGLAMATMDTISYAGYFPANFLDIGGGVDERAILKALEIILENKSVKIVFINIFGGIVKCDLIANALLQSIVKSKLNMPFVVRFDGTNATKAKDILKNTNNIFLASSLLDAINIIKQIKKG